MIDLADIKLRARNTLERRLFGNIWLTLLLCDLIAGAILGVPNLLSRLFVLISPKLAALLSLPIFLCALFLTGPLTYGTARLYHKTAKTGVRPSLSELFCGFREDLGESFLLGITRTLLIFLWSLLLIIPGIIKSYAYSMAFYIQQESEDKNWRLCLDKSAELTQGYKGKLFLLDLSFIGWYLVGLLCLGVGMLWVSVYHGIARAHFYEELKRIKGEALGEASSEGAGAPYAGVSGDAEGDKEDFDPFAELTKTDSDESDR